ncbi:MAG: NAD-dependent deacetylase [Flavobacteriales bacterium]
MQRIVAFTGAGVSAESGIDTFRDSGGLWDRYNIADVATPEAFARDPKTVLEFYNERRRKVLESEPNPAHQALAELEEAYEVVVVTQNIDDLHERAGSSKVLHLHGEIKKVRSSVDPELIYEVGEGGIELGQTCDKGSQLRPHVVWFGEAVPMLEKAALEIEQADILLVIGSSLNVYPAAGLVFYARPEARKFLIDPKADEDGGAMEDFELISEKAGQGVPRIVERLMAKEVR